MSEKWDFDKCQPIAENFLRQFREIDKDKQVEEYDLARRNCKVWMITQDIGMYGAALGKATGSESLKHWVVVCDFGNRKIKYELNNPSGKFRGGKIFPSWYEGIGNQDEILPSWCYEMADETAAEEVKKPQKPKEPNVAEIGTIVTSPRKVLELVCNHEMNFNTYNAVDYNCQHWAMKLLKAMSEGQDQDLQKTAQEEGRFKPVSESDLRWPVQSLVKSSTFSQNLSQKKKKN